jgi:hypothetical protein
MELAKQIAAKDTVQVEDFQGDALPKSMDISDGKVKGRPMSRIGGRTPCRSIWMW